MVGFVYIFFLRCNNEEKQQDFTKDQISTIGGGIYLHFFLWCNNEEKQQDFTKDQISTS